jgi:hypothetical protein
VHQAVADDLGHDRGGGDRGAPLVPVDDGRVLRCGGAEPEAVDEADLAGGRQGMQDGAQAPEVADM